MQKFATRDRDAPRSEAQKFKDSAFLVLRVAVRIFRRKTKFRSQSEISFRSQNIEQARTRIKASGVRPQTDTACFATKILISSLRILPLSEDGKT
ncbi:hypothetical protein [Microcoleus sp. herbarium12]|uniref:hypothetical protein n=1 Tax=Microcoleus sp. herbarium12 TaxID=3055437 RepID=UPI002FD42EAD